MKNKIVLLFVLAIQFVMFNKSLAQWAFNGDAISAGQFIGTTNQQPFELKTTNTTGPQPINFYTNNTQKMTLDASGNLGINITSPQNLLHLHSGTFQLTNSSTGSGSSNEGFQMYLSSSDGVINNKENASDIDFYTTSSNNNTLKMILKAQGDVGIGVSTPGRKLEVNHGGMGSGPQLRLSYTQGSVYTDFLTNSSGYLYIDATSNRVGIEESSPAVTLDVNGDIRMNIPTSDASSDFIVIDGDGDLLKRSITNVVNTCGTANQYYVPKFCSPSTGIVNSQIYDNSFIGMNTTSAGLENSFVNVVAPSGYNGISVRGNYTAAGHSRGLYVDNVGGTSDNAGSHNAGLEAYCNVTSATGGSSQPLNYGILTTSLSDNPDGLNFGIYAQGNGGEVNYGVAGIADGDEEYNIGVYGRGYEDEDDWAAYFDGDTRCTDGVWETSDANLKDNIEPLTDAMSLLEQLQPKTYYFKTEDYPQMGLSTRKQYGFIADEVQPILPDLVKDTRALATYDADGNQITPEVDYSTMNYIHIIPILVGAIQELKAQVDACDCGAGLRSSDPNDGNGQSINLVTKNQIQLGNATPNPNGGLTSIPFQLPQSVVKAEMVFTDLLGQEVNRVELGARGFSKIDVTTTNLEDGTYNYTLIADGKVIDTKQMVKQH